MKLSKEDIKSILDANKIEGRIETGYKYWLCGFIMLPYKHKLEDFVSQLKVMMENTDGCYHPMESTFIEYDKSIDRLVNKLYNSSFNI